MTDIVEFLTARLDEEEARQQRLVYGDAHWESLHTSARLGSWTYSRQHGITVATNDAVITAGLARVRETFDNWQRQNAKQWLADVAAKRTMLREIEAITIRPMDGQDDPVAMDRPAGRLLRAMAAVYDQSPDYDPAWRVA